MKKLICITLMFLCNECLAIGELPKAVSGDLICSGGDDGQTASTVFILRNFNEKPISLGITLFSEQGEIMHIPSKYQSIKVNPYATYALSSTNLLAGSAGGRLILKATFSTKTNDSWTTITAPYGLSNNRLMDPDGKVTSKDTVECVYNNLFRLNIDYSGSSSSPATIP